MSNRQGEPYESFRVDVEQSHRVSEVTIAYYDRMAEAYWDGTRDHDVSQNYTAFLDAIENDPPYSILDLGCGPGRDLRHFRSLGHNAVDVARPQMDFCFRGKSGRAADITTKTGFDPEPVIRRTDRPEGGWGARTPHGRRHHTHQFGLCLFTLKCVSKNFNAVFPMYSCSL